MKIFIFSLFFLISCSEEQAYRIGYALGEGIVGSISSKDEKIINNSYYYKTMGCDDHRYTDYNFNALIIDDCVISNELHYVSFEAGRVSAAYIFDL